MIGKCGLVCLFIYFYLHDMLLNFFICRSRYLIELEKLVKAYNSLHMSMSPIEFTILRDHVKRMNDVLEPSFTYLNWSSQGVLGFITKANNAIDTFKSFLEETRKHSTGKFKHFV